MILRAGRRINADELRIRRMKDGQSVHCRDTFSNQKPDSMRGKTSRTTDTFVVLSISVSDRGRAHMVNGTCTDVARRSCCAHRSQRIAEIEGEIIRRSTEEHYQRDET